MKNFKLVCIDCKKTILCPIAKNEKVLANIKRGYIVRCFDCENTLFYKTRPDQAGKSLAQIFKKESNRKVINFV